MSIKHLILFAVFAANVFVIAVPVSPRVGPIDPDVKRLNPGLSVRFPAESFINGPIEFEGTIAHDTTDNQERVFGYFNQQSDGSWVYQNTSVSLNQGDSLTYSAVESQAKSSGLCLQITRYLFRVPYEAVLLTPTDDIRT